MQNRRILIYNLTSGNILADRIPDFVLGASDFVTPGVITSPTPSNFLPLALAYDSVNNRLFVGDNQSRVLVFDTTTITNGMNAVNVLGKPDFVTGGVPTATQSSIYTPYGLAYHPVTNRLFVLDGSLNRVLVFDTTTITDGENAVNVLGQPNFTSSATATNQAGMNFPM
jgi:DNA-binding beta-propeller fold protein YncE